MELVAAAPPKITRQTLAALKVLALSPGAAGVEIGRATGLASGSLYPILRRLERAGWLEGEWELGDLAELRRPRRRHYRLTEAGMRRLHGLLLERRAAAP